MLICKMDPLRIKGLWYSSVVGSTLRRCISTKVTAPFNYVSGRRADPKDRVKVVNVNEPATGGILCKVPASGKKEVNKAVEAAKEGFEVWSKMSGLERGRILTSAGRRIRDYLEDIAKLEVHDTGKPIWEARVDIGSCADAFEYFGGMASSINGQHVKLPRGSFVMVQKEPLGVVAGIGAWNFPMQTCSWKVAPALACGNAIIYKPSQFTPITAVTLAEILTEVGLPDGAFNVVQGEGDTGSFLCDHPDVAKVSFTGSISTGIKIMQKVAEGMKKVTLELGGKSPLVIFDDADLTNAVKGALMANFLSQGEVCSNGTRVFVHRKLKDAFTEKVVDAAKKMKIGDPFDETTTVGATIHEDHARNVLSYVQSAKAEGATVAYGGERVLLPGKLSGGYYLSPCVLTECQDSMRAVKEEIFGSVLAILDFEDEEEVIHRANNSPFGLAGAVFTKDIQRAHRVANQLQAGTVWINTYNLYPPEVPFGGYKMSGIGRENGSAVLDHYTQTKTVYVEMGDVDCGPLYN